jgi:WhiB family redox-sensing transcriptional regulator
MNAWERLADAVGAAPALPGARCRGRSELFDAESVDDERTDYAITVCNRCPALAACREWVASLPPGKRPIGVVAGRVIGPKVRKKLTA